MNRAVPGLEGLDDDALLDLAEAVLGRLADDPLRGLSDKDVSQSVARLHRLETVVCAEKLRRVAEVDERQAYRVDGCRSTAELLAERLRLTHVEAKAQAQTATALRQLPDTARKLAAGELGIAQAQVAARALQVTPPEARPELDRLVAQQGPTIDRRRLRDSVDEWQHGLDVGILEDREAAAWRRRDARTWTDADGSLRMEARLAPAGGATVQAAFDALSRPTGPGDERSFGQRQADALVTLAEQALNGGGLPEVAAQRPHLVLIATVAALAEAPGAPPARLDGYGAVSSTTARLLACDAETTTVTLARNGAVLDAGRTRREPSRRQRAAVIARDHGCVGCGAPAARCQVHHIRHWADGGSTDVDNLALLCWSCHHGVHQDGWRVIRGPDGRFTTRPPPHSGLAAGAWSGPQRR